MAQEASMLQHEYTDRKNNNVIFMYIYVHIASTKLEKFAGEITSTIIEILTKLCQAFPKYKLSNVGLISFFSFCQGVKVAINCKQGNQSP